MITNYDVAIRDAVDRDLADAERLTHIQQIVTTALDALAHDCGPLRHPDAEWNPDDLLEMLSEAAIDVGHELARVSSGPVVLEDW